jgi:hypothetical protein
MRIVGFTPTFTYPRRTKQTTKAKQKAAGISRYYKSTMVKSGMTRLERKVRYWQDVEFLRRKK